MLEKFVIMPISKRWLDMIICGHKVVELRRKDIRADVHEILFYENKTGLITASCSIRAIWHKAVCDLRLNVAKSKTCVSDDELEKYARGKTHLLAIELNEARRLAVPITLTEASLNGHPQSYVYREFEFDYVYRRTR